MVRPRVTVVGVLVLVATASTFVGGAVPGAGGPAADTGIEGTSPAALDAASGAVAPGVGNRAATDTPTPSQPSTDTTVTRIEVLPNGSARWTIEIRTRLETAEEADDFRAFQRAFRNDTDRYLGPFADRMRSVVANAANATGREMRAVDFRASTSIQEVPRRWGVVSYSFLWTNFAASDGDDLVVGDVFEGGFFLATNDSMTVRAPEGFRIASVDPGPTDRERRRVTWEGRQDFDGGRPRVRMVPAERTASPTNAPGDGTADGTASPATSGGGLPGWLPILAVLLLVAGGGAAFYVRRSDGPGPTSGRTGGEPPSAGSAGEGPAGSPGEGPAGSPGEGPSEAPGGGAGSTGTEGAGTGASSPPVLTDEERVEELLRSGEGRMRQADVADELDWSASKTSRVLSSMAEEGRIEKLQLGRENLIELPEQE